MTAFKNGIEYDFKNNAFYLFHAEQPLLESYQRNIKKKGKNYTFQFLKGVFNYQRIQSEYDSISMHAIVFDWGLYKPHILNEQPIDSNLYLKKNTLLNYHKNEN